MEALVENCDIFIHLVCYVVWGEGVLGATLISYPESYLEFYFIKIALHDKEKFKKTVQIYTIEINEKKFKINNKKKHTKS